MLRLCGQLLRKQGGSSIAFSLKQNVNYFQTNTRTSQICLVKRSASTSLAGPGAPNMKTEEKITPLGWFLMVSGLKK